MQVSIVVPTYYRRKDLDECLNSIIIQTILPKAVIMVDDSENNEIENLIEQGKIYLNRGTYFKIYWS